MRYQYPIPNPTAHYWEEEVYQIWRVPAKSWNAVRRYLNYFLGEILIANIFLLFEIALTCDLALAIRRRTAVVIAMIQAGPTAKRIIDIAGASIFLILSLPLWIIISLAIKIDSRGPIFYCQERVGRNRRRVQRRAVVVDGVDRRKASDRRAAVGFGKSFMIIKFRSMRQDAEKGIGPVWATKNDSRVTRVGRLLRICRFDEIPQLINVLKGDMSLVGPRPERPFFVNDLSGILPEYAKRFNVKPGITGLAQVEHKYDENLEDVTRKVSYDLNYIKNWSVLQDLRIIARTALVVISARGM